MPFQTLACIAVLTLLYMTMLWKLRSVTVQMLLIWACCHWQRRNIATAGLQLSNWLKLNIESLRRKNETLNGKDILAQFGEKIKRLLAISLVHTIPLLRLIQLRSLKQNAFTCIDTTHVGAIRWFGTGRHTFLRKFRQGTGRGWPRSLIQFLIVPYTHSSCTKLVTIALLNHRLGHSQMTVPCNR